MGDKDTKNSAPKPPPRPPGSLVRIQKRGG